MLIFRFLFFWAICLLISLTKIVTPFSVRVKQFHSLHHRMTSDHDLRAGIRWPVAAFLLVARCPAIVRHNGAFLGGFAARESACLDLGLILVLGFIGVFGFPAPLPLDPSVSRRGRRLSENRVVSWSLLFPHKGVIGP